MLGNEVWNEMDKINPDLDVVVLLEDEEGRVIGGSLERFNFSVQGNIVRFKVPGYALVPTEKEVSNEPNENKYITEMQKQLLEVYNHTFVREDSEIVVDGTMNVDSNDNVTAKENKQ